MHFHFPLAAGDPVTWQGIIAGLSGAGVVGTVFTFFLTRYGKKADDAAAAAKEAAANSAAVRIVEIGNTEKLEDAYRREIHRLIDEANARIVKLEARCAETDDKLEFIRAKHIHLFVYAERLQDRNMSLVRVIKSLDPKFDASEFAPIDLSHLSPENVFFPTPRAPAQVTVSVAAAPTATAPTREAVNPR